jgi:C4-dicarboxylate-specific signal transduction histidine kinase
MTPSDSTGRELRLSRQVYRLRALGLATGGISVATVLFARQTGWPAWTALGLHVFLWPHLAWHLARTSRDPHRMERTSLTIDSAFGGMWVALMHFNLLPSVLIVVMLSMDKIGWGPRLLARTSAAMAAACVAGMLLTGFRVEPATSLREIVASLPLVVAYPLAVAFASYHSGRLTRERNRQTAALREQLAHVARVGTLGEMAAGLAHELNQPLTAIHFEAGAALEDNDPDDMRRALAAIAGHSLRAGDVVRRMRIFARRGEPKREPTDIRQLIREVLALLAHDLRLNSVQTREMFDEVPAVMVDRIELQQVMVNLIRNAMEAMMATPIADRCLSIETRPAGGRVRVSVSDCGSGVDPVIAATLFHPFHTTKPSGLGLGLSICQSLIEGHAGRIGIAAAAGRGTTFFFELPAAATPAGAAS